MSNATQERGHQDDMAEDVTNEQRWQEFLEAVRLEWAVLQDSDMKALQEKDFAADNHEGLIGRLRERYDLTMSDAREKVERFLQRLRTPKKMS